MIPVCALPFCSSKIHPNIISWATMLYLQWSPYFEFHYKTLHAYACHFSPMEDTFPADLIFLVSTVLTIFVKKHKLWSFSLWNFLQYQRKETDHRGMNYLYSFERCGRGFESHSRHGCLYCVRLFCACVVLCVGNGLATGWSPIQGVLRPVYRIKKLKRPRPNKWL
jgi:hypothetical protein